MIKFNLVGSTKASHVLAVLSIITGILGMLRMFTDQNSDEMFLSCVLLLVGMHICRELESINEKMDGG